MNEHLNPAAYYHYCSTSTFQNIIQGKALWMSDIDKANDYLERRWFFNLLKEEFAKYYKRLPVGENETPEQTAQRESLESYFRRFFQEDLELSDSVVMNAWDICYVTCFSSENDSLSMWRGYADDGYGMAIGFRAELLNAVNTLGREEERDVCQSYFAFGKVEYDKIAQTKYAREALSAEFKKKPSDRSHGTSFLFHAITDNLQRSLFYKMPIFADEREWRLIWRDIKSSEDSLLSKGSDTNELDLGAEKGYLTIGERNFYARREQLISYRPFIFGDYDAPIVEIVIGPKNRMTEDDVRLFLAKCGYIQSIADTTIHIRKSAASYR